MHPFYISVQVLKVLLIKFYKIQPPVLIFLMFYISFYTSADIIFDSLLELHSTLFSEKWAVLPLPSNLPFGRNPVDTGEESHPATQKMLISHTRKIPLTKQHFSRNHSIQASFMAVIAFFNFRLYIQLYHANFDQPTVTESYMTKVLNVQNSSKQNSQPPSPPFNAIWKTLL